ncbi:hypothetical protein QNI19_24745 [Cytophagaceae bacterium DM2B3-1]|uniref:DUF2178 domain-containing protein n=1 Tax=Xanthocytophaga flava TaxID=3048013 RepID=A0ABT7CQZ4_9BACT|nr:hypothetical protein [Xanthocytophaga flavus]MDJ1496169.1 hypothetical protein [Xanthocytophaga flavus]
MKKILVLSMIMAVPLAANAENGSYINQEVFNICSVIFLVGMGMLFLLTILKRILDFRLKNKIVEKGIDHTMAASILETNPQEGRNINIKWFAILAGLGSGLTLIHYTLPLGIHSMAIMSFCLAVSFLGYFFFLRQTER